MNIESQPKRVGPPSLLQDEINAERSEQQEYTFKFDVSKTTIRAVLERKTWKHI